MLGHILGFIFSPEREWSKVCGEKYNLQGIFYVMLLATIPVIAFYYGVAETGWRVGDGDIQRMTSDSALTIVALFYFAMVVTVACLGYMVHWMATEYGSDSTTLKGIAVVGYCCTPLFLSGLVGFIPIIWLNMLVGVLAVCHSVYLLYAGIPVVMNIPGERGFLFASAIVAVALVMLVSLLGATVILWEMGVMPEFTD